MGMERVWWHIIERVLVWVKSQFQDWIYCGWDASSPDSSFLYVTPHLVLIPTFRTSSDLWKCTVFMSAIPLASRWDSQQSWVPGIFGTGPTAQKISKNPFYWRDDSGLLSFFFVTLEFWNQRFFFSEKLWYEATDFCRQFGQIAQKWAAFFQQRLSWPGASSCVALKKVPICWFVGQPDMFQEFTTWEAVWQSMKSPLPCRVSFTLLEFGRRCRKQWILVSLWNTHWPPSSTHSLHH